MKEGTVQEISMTQTRRAAIRSLGVAAGLAGGFLPRGSVAWGHDLKPSDPAFRFAEYEAIVSRSDLKIRQVYEWPNINNAPIYANIRNGLNGFQFSYEIPPDLVQVVVLTYAFTTPITYDDFIWDKYRFGESTGIRDPLTGEPARRNIWYSSRVPYQDLQGGHLPQSRSHPFYSDVSIEGLQRRRVLFLTCHQTVHNDARVASLSTTGRNPDGKTEDEILAEIERHLVPGCFLIPSGVGELVRLQDKGYRLVVNH
jgi:hypothetical protein